MLPVKVLQTLFTAMDLSEQSYLNIDGLMDMIGTGHLHPSSPGDDIKGNPIQCDQISAYSSESAV
jgi:hypothetical protein